MTDPRRPDAAKVAALRDALPATGAGIYLDTATRGPLPAETAAAMREADDWELRVGRAAAGRDEDVAQRTAEGRAVLAALLAAQPDEVALVPSLEVGLAAAAWAPEWRPGDHAVVAADADPRLRAALRAVADRFAIEVQTIAAGATDEPESTLAALSAAVTERTRLVALSLVSPVTGSRLPVPEIGRLAGPDRWLILEASQAAGAVPLVAADTGADFIGFATDGWCLGPEGTAALWAGGRAIRDAQAVFGGRPPGAHDAGRFEPSALPRTALLGLARSVGWLEMYVGLDWALERTAALATRLHAGLARTPGVELLTPAGSMAAIVTFHIAGWSTAEVVEELGRRIFAILATTADPDAIRASVAWFNTEDELDRFVEAVALLGAHTPSTLPRRPSLVVVPAPNEGAHE